MRVGTGHRPPLVGTRKSRIGLCSLLYILVGINVRFLHDVFGPVVVGATIVIGRDYFERHAETLLKLAKSATDPQVAAALTDRAADLKALVEELGAAPDPGHRALDIEAR